MPVIVTAYLADVSNLGNLDKGKVWVEVDGIDFQADMASFIEDERILQEPLK